MACSAAREFEEPTSFAGALFDMVQDSALMALDTGLDFAHRGALYVAQEIVFALGEGEIDERSMDMSSRRDLSTLESRKVRSSSIPHPRKARKQEKKSKKKRKKQIDLVQEKTNAVQEKEIGGPDIKLYNGEVESRDEPDERPERLYRVKDLIGKFDGASRGTVGISPTHLIEQLKRNNLGQTKQDPPMTTHGRDPQAQGENNVHEVFRPRTAAPSSSQDPDRYSYLTIDQARNLPRPASPLTPFKDLHRANQKALFDGSSMEASLKDKAAESKAFVESFLASSAAPGGLVRPVDPQQEQKEQRASEIVDIRTEIEDIHRILAKLQLTRDAQRRNQELEPTMRKDTPSKDKKQSQELLSFIGRLQRLSKRHQELKLQNALATADSTLAALRPIQEERNVEQGQRVGAPMDPPMQTA